jgi:lincosamide nucleotidyltransferase A/C/D/E
MTSEKVLQIMQTFININVRVWIAGGWAVDALVGKQTRQHNDLDIAFDTKDERKIINTFNDLGYKVKDDNRPTRFVLRKNDGTEVDMHPVVFEEDGIGKQLVPKGNPFIYPTDAFSEGTIDNQKVPCLSAKQLIEFHTGYTPLDKDKHNMKILHKYLNIELPEVYKL